MSDSAVAGAGVYADSKVGACGSTGDGDLHLRFLPCYQARCSFFTYVLQSLSAKLLL